MTNQKGVSRLVSEEMGETIRWHLWIAPYLFEDLVAIWGWIGFGIDFDFQTWYFLASSVQGKSTRNWTWSKKD